MVRAIVGANWGDEDPGNFPIIQIINRIQKQTYNLF